MNSAVKRNAHVRDLSKARQHVQLAHAQTFDRGVVFMQFNSLKEDSEFCDIRLLLSNNNRVADYL